MEKGGYVYILTNKNHNVLYTGSTTEIMVRTSQHQVKFYENSFTAKYNVNILVYYQRFPTIMEARAEENRIKGGSRAKKIKLINEMNPEWKNLFDEI